jgi:asparagine synthase (glutamine-hydrolysing)
MCGICGVVQIGGEPRPVVSVDVLNRMTDVMTHRGPDDRGTYSSDGVALGVRRLSIVDVEGGHQPFSNEDGGIWGIQNGELYNHDRLREQLAPEGHVFRSRCDTEVLPHLYEQCGERYPERLRGKFATAVWDNRSKTAVVARDRLGVKPLYYAVCDDLVVFGSELKSVLASGLVGDELDYEAIDAYLMFGFVPAPRTPLAGVSKLPPGHRLIVGDGKVVAEPYWRYPRPAVDEGSPASLDDAAQGLLEALDESVRLRLMSDVPLGAMLSGGLDSSLIVALMARHSNEPVKTFSVGFAESSGANELDDARYVSELFGTEHHELELSLADRTLDLENLVWHLDEPLADLSGLGFLALSDLAARHVKVALSGQGADELFGGYMKHQAASFCAAWMRMPRSVRNVEARFAPLARGRLRRAARTLAAPDAATRLVAMSGKLDPDVRRRLVQGPLAGTDGRAAERSVRALLNGMPDDPVATTLFLDGQLALVDDMLHYFDRTSMAHSLEVRVPFLDHELVEYCATIPSRYKVRGLARKIVLKRAARGIIPNRIIDKRKIGFFRPAVAEWFRAQSEGAIAEYLSGSPRCTEFLDPGELRALVHAQTLDPKARHPHLLLAILMLEAWLSSYLPRAFGSFEPARERIRIPA